MKRLYTIRLYKKHDMDLLSLRLRGVDLADAVHQSLIAFVEGRDMILSLPPSRNNDDKRINTVTKIEKKITLDDEDDIDVEIINMLERINEGAWNNFFKNILRMYLWHPYAENYIKSSKDLQFFENQTEIYKKNKEKFATRREKRKKVKKLNQQVKKEETSKSHSSIPSPESIPQKVYDNIIDLTDEENTPVKKGAPAEKITSDTDIEPIARNKSVQANEAVSHSYGFSMASFEQNVSNHPVSKSNTDVAHQIYDSKEDDDMDDITKAFSELLM